LQRETNTDILTLDVLRERGNTCMERRDSPRIEKQFGTPTNA